jgi:hypothetical protein
VLVPPARRSPRRKLVTVSIMAALGIAASACATPSEPRLAEATMKSDFQDVEAVRTVVASIPHQLDFKHWPEVRRLFAARVRTDYTSLFGGTPQEQTADALVGGWERVLAKVSTQHMLGPIEVRIDGAKATARCHVRGIHLAEGAPGGPEWEAIGHYVFGLVREGDAWRIDSLTLQMLMQTGNRKLLEEAGAAK